MVVVPYFEAFALVLRVIALEATAMVLELVLLQKLDGYFTSRVVVATDVSQRVFTCRAGVMPG